MFYIAPVFQLIRNSISPIKTKEKDFINVYKKDICLAFTAIKHFLNIPLTFDHDMHICFSKHFFNKYKLPLAPFLHIFRITLNSIFEK